MNASTEESRAPYQHRQDLYSLSYLGKEFWVHCLSWTACPAWGQRVRDFLASGQKVRTVCAWADQYRTFSRSGSPIWALGPFGPEAAQSQHFLKGILTEVAGQDFQEFWVYCLSWTACPAWGQRVHDFLASGQRVLPPSSETEVCTTCTNDGRP